MMIQKNYLHLTEIKKVVNDMMQKRMAGLVNYTPHKHLSLSHTHCSDKVFLSDSGTMESIDFLSFDKNNVYCHIHFCSYKQM